MQNGTLGERSPNHHGVNGRFCPFNGCRSCDLHVLRTVWRPRTPNLSAFAQVGHVPTYIFGSIQHRSAPRAVLGAPFGTQIAPDRHKKCPRWQITPSGALKTVVLHLIQGMPMLNTPKNARRKRGYLLNRLNTRKFAVAIDIAGKYHLDGALLDGHRRGPSPQQIIA